MRERADAANVDDEVGMAVTIDVARKEHVTGCPDEMQLTGPVMKGLRANELKGLVAHLPRVGIDAGEVDPVTLDVAEVHDHVGGGGPALLDPAEVERIGAGAAEELVSAQSAAQRIVAKPATEDVVAV